VVGDNNSVGDANAGDRVVVDDAADDEDLAHASFASASVQEQSSIARSCLTGLGTVQEQSSIARTRLTGLGTVQGTTFGQDDSRTNVSNARQVDAQSLGHLQGVGVHTLAELRTPDGTWTELALSLGAKERNIVARAHFSTEELMDLKQKSRKHKQVKAQREYNARLAYGSSHGQPVAEPKTMPC
jgi:hypothetical protein